MDSAHVERLTAEASVQYLRLYDEATNLLRNLDRTSPTQMAAKVVMRQNIIELIQKFDQDLRLTFPERSGVLARFRAFQDKTTRQILEIDGLVIALLRLKQQAIKTRLTSVKKSKVALNAYQNRAPRTQSHWLNNRI
jgi:hypothetical protein